ncbi:VOC family protein [Ihubacter massiliensis]|uniref:VOC family protein n=1 Tax=Hominibacterium faecale TaxID=2839743 RepID=A0A9J6QVY4_9FIRM|nr:MULTISPECIES: VOC family protein [Eubacteriales Family XIII. Incertae Sedis]MCC2865872.1 VOC family protein [Anaerovorax odorimutans]MCI7301102.1 VOC family protein [Clostridia bacterium]MDE8735090.1 VOC family protein [Eubacteriales bacterium DFI.9.88]MDY3011870.1 VOC family protein [Clostridiales Family XIII bacterium]MCO7123348.1 VOC family protein [Ihubacter massiliensis]
MKFTFATIHVKDLEESIRFYEDVIGMNTARRFAAGPNTEIAFMEDGPAEIELICDKTAAPGSFSEDLSLGLSVDSLDEAMAEMERQGVVITGGPIQPNPNTRFFFIKDPNGVTLEIIEQK